tara:strand:- start:730 stop:1371 length:642 start_codon:yes stop_codon:yes gene_type:complete
MSKAKKFWDNASKNYDNTEKRFEYIHSKSRENTKQYLKSSDTVLDFACGTGTTSIEISDLVKEIHAIDISPKMIELAKEKAVINKVNNVFFEQGEIFDTKYKTESFDTVIAFNILHTIPNAQNIVKRIDELLKPNGLFISVTPCLQDKMSFLVSMQIRLVQVMCKIGIIPIPIRRLKSEDIDDLLEYGTFQTVNSEKIYKGASSYFIVVKKVS